MSLAKKSYTMVMLVMVAFLQVNVSTAYAAAILPDLRGGRVNLASWDFSTMTTANSLVSNNGVLSDSLRIAAIGRRGETDIPLTMGVGSSDGQLYIAGWENASIFEKYWLIDESVPVHNILSQYRNIDISFQAYSSVTGPRNFVLEVDYGNGWTAVSSYVLTSTPQNFTFRLPAADGCSLFNVRLRATNNRAVNNHTVMANGTSRIYKRALKNPRNKTPGIFQHIFMHPIFGNRKIIFFSNQQITPIMPELAPIT